MHSHHLIKGLKIVLFAFVIAIVLGFVVKSLWNALMPGIFGWHMISFWQALGLLLLSKLLFGGFHHRGGGGRHWKNRMRERWEGMSPENATGFARECDAVAGLSPPLLSRSRSDECDVLKAIS